LPQSTILPFAKHFQKFLSIRQTSNYLLLVVRKMQDVNDSAGYHKWEQEFLHSIQATKGNMITLTEETWNRNNLHDVSLGTHGRLCMDSEG
jgi:hypothetical protein